MMENNNDMFAENAFDSQEMKNKSKELGEKYIGFHNHRLINDFPREQAFSEEWKKNNIHRTWVNRGNGILQDLFIDDNGGWHHTMTSNDKMIASTIVQWLGTNCGMAFLETSLQNCGYKIVPIKE